MLYAFGSNGAGQLGVGHKEDLSTATPIPTLDVPWEVLQLTAGGNHTVMLCSDAQVRAMGHNEDGRCGGVAPGKELLNPTQTFLIPSDHSSSTRVEHVTATWSATSLSCTDGSVFVCGSGHNGELGLGPGVVRAETPCRLRAFPPPGTTVTLLSSGLWHTIAVLSNREVYGWGRGKKGQLGGTKADVWSPRKISELPFGPCETVVAACCGKDFTLLVGQRPDSRICILGLDSNDRFGIRQAEVALSVPQSITASWNGIYALQTSGVVVGWGRNDYGQLPPQSLPQIKSVAAGSEHCIALTRNDEVIAWGWGEHGNCGRPTTALAPGACQWTRIEVPGCVSRVFAGCATSFVQVADTVRVRPEG